MFVVVLPQIVFCENNEKVNANPNNDNEKYMQTGIHAPPSSLYCNDLNPQMQVDFNLV